MQAEPQQVTIDDVLLVLGRSTLEVALLRARVVELERQLSASTNGLVSIPMETEHAG
jgi:hypothetical protein